ncbi:polysaccharide deacetylase family protein [Halalkalicoccus jeotgali]|uniref:Polysaccharide deacetylase n=1 Tax=Halalkalicoccus jeotgali (strain DSM 18796 / CECT 7217 / JCM 14584 / KCTC 4019 / B3) TaxID=795797 RepID=D8JD94_HALJB|nr:polysaccharide deacetylase family protein [Halalkalicoccus jeotgali]ADJ17247.1 polysaccharide deacetylase [Halalkalicoccus jeotgali B3]ELY41958.1 polysaccharide deacetylase [Halalkalicoccus jeotgali B3]
MKGRRPTRRGVLQNVFGIGLFSWFISKIKQLFGVQSDSGRKSPEEMTTENKPLHADQEQAKEPKEEEEDPQPTLPENGAIVFVYDDGAMEDYTQALPAHKAFDAPATTGIVSEWVGTSGYMDTEELDELVEAGWEIASHTKEHRPLASFPLTEDTNHSDTIVSAEGYRHGHHEGETVEITDGETKVLREIAGLAGEPGERRVKLTEPVDEHFHAGETEIHYPAAVMHEAVDDSKKALEEMGYDVSTILAPYDVYSGYSNLFVKEQYDGVANAEHGSRINHPDEYDPYETQRDYFIEFTDKKSVKHDLDKIADDALLGVVGAHSFKDEVNEESIQEMLEWVEERDIETMTLREAIETYD